MFNTTEHLWETLFMSMRPCTDSDNSELLHVISVMYEEYTVECNKKHMSSYCFLVTVFSYSPPCCICGGWFVFFVLIAFSSSPKLCFKRSVVIFSWASHSHITCPYKVLKRKIKDYATPSMICPAAHLYTLLNVADHFLKTLCFLMSIGQWHVRRK